MHYQYTCISFNVLSFPKIVPHKCLHVSHSPRGTVEGQLVAGAKLSLEAILGSKTAKTSKVHDPDSRTEMVGLFHGMGGEYLREEREGGRGRGGRREREGGGGQIDREGRKRRREGEGESVRGPA